MMIYLEEYKEHIEYISVAFCKLVLRNVKMNAYCDFGWKQKREVLIEYLMSKTSFKAFTIEFILSSMTNLLSLL